MSTDLKTKDGTIIFSFGESYILIPLKEYNRMKEEMEQMERGDSEVNRLYIHERELNVVQEKSAVILNIATMSLFAKNSSEPVDVYSHYYSKVMAAFGYIKEWSSTVPVNRIEAIKWLRNHFGITLRSSKYFLDMCMIKENAEWIKSTEWGDYYVKEEDETNSD